MVQLKWVPSHLDVEGNEAADALAHKGRRRSGMGLELMAESDDREVGSEVDSMGQLHG